MHWINKKWNKISKKIICQEKILQINYTWKNQNLCPFKFLAQNSIEIIN